MEALVPILMMFVMISADVYAPVEQEEKVPCYIKRTVFMNSDRASSLNKKTCLLYGDMTSQLVQKESLASYPTRRRVRRFTRKEIGSPTSCSAGSSCSAGRQPPTSCQPCSMYPCSYFRTNCVLTSRQFLTNFVSTLYHISAFVSVSGKKQFPKSHLTLSLKAT
jgi:hypothetical protein